MSFYLGLLKYIIPGILTGYLKTINIIQLKLRQEAILICNFGMILREQMAVRKLNEPCFSIKDDKY